MDFNQPTQFPSTSRPPLQMHGFMPLQAASTTSYGNHRIEGGIRYSRSISQLSQNLKFFWKERCTEICDAPSDVRGQHALPLARIKKVMKSDEQVKMVSAYTPVVFAKACEMFIMELTLRAWMHTRQNNRKTLQRNDVANAIRDDDLLFFLKDIVPVEIHQTFYPTNQEMQCGSVFLPPPPPILSPPPRWPANGDGPYFSFK